MSSGSIESTTNESAGSLAATEPTPAPYLRRIWERMAAVYPNRWRAAMGESPQGEGGKLTVYGDTWAKGLAGLTVEELARGLESCLSRADAWPPTLPEFRALCLAIPSLAQVREDLTREHQDREPFTIMVGRRLDSHRYRQAPTHEADRQLREAYDDAREARMKGAPLPEPLPQLDQEKPVVVPASREVARRNLDELRAFLGGGA